MGRVGDVSANGLMESDVKWIRDMTAHAIYAVVIGWIKADFVWYFNFYSKIARCEVSKEWTLKAPEF